MKKKQVPLKERTNILSMIMLIIMMSFNFSFETKAQITTMNDYVVFGGDLNCPTGPGQTPPSGSSLGSGCRVHMGVGSVINGNVGSYHFVEANGDVTINGNIYSGGRVNLANGDAVNRVTAADGDLEIGTIFGTGNGASIFGNVDVNGNITVNPNAGSFVNGTVTHPFGTTYTGPLPGGGEVVGPPSLPVLPVMPPIAVLTCPTGSATNITGTAVLTPGSYGNLILGNGAGQTVTFSGPGNYYFNTIKMGQGPTHTFIYDFLNLAGNINIYVCGDVDMGLFNATFANPSVEDACRIYFETQGDGSTNGGDHTFSFLIGAGSHFFGTVWAPYAAIHIGSGSCCTFATGHLWSATQVDVQHGVTINSCNSCTRSITITKAVVDPCPNNTLPPYPAQWDYTSNIPGHLTFSLPAAGGSINFPGIAPGSYTITETAVAGWTTSSVVPVCASGTSSNNNSVTFNFGASDCGDCGATFTNTRVIPHTITITKAIVDPCPNNVNPPYPAAWNFTSNIPGFATFSIPATGGSISFPNLADGSYTVTETAVAGWTSSVVAPSCASGTSSTTNSVTFVFGPNDCNGCTATFTNTRAIQQCVTIRKFVGLPTPTPGFCCPPLIQNWSYTSTIPGHGSFTISAITPRLVVGVLVGYDGFVTFCDVPPGTYTVTETYVPPIACGGRYVPTNSCMANPATDSLIATITVVACVNPECAFQNIPFCQQINTCQWCDKGAVLSQVKQNMNDTCAIPDILVDVRMAHGGANDVVDASEIHTGQPATWSIQAAVNYANSTNDPNVLGDGQIFIGVTATDGTDAGKCGYGCARPPAGDNPHGNENVIVTNTHTQRMNIFGCSVTIHAANPALPVIIVQNGVGKITILDLHVKYSNVQGYLIQNNADLVVVKNSAAWYNNIGYDVNDNNVQITGSQHTRFNAIGALIRGSGDNILRTNSDMTNNGIAIKITGNNNTGATDGNEVGTHNFPNGTGILITGNGNKVHGDAVTYNTGDGINVTGTGNTIDEEKVENNGGRGVAILASSNLVNKCTKIDHNGSHGIYVATSTASSLQSNESDNNAGDGINANSGFGASGTLVKNNKAKDNSLHGIRACGQVNQGGNTASGNLVNPQIAFTGCTTRDASENTLNSTSGSLLEFYPNPTDGIATIKFISVNNENVHFSVLDIAGRVVMSDVVESVEGVNTLDMDLRDLQPGVYMLDMQNSKMHEMKKIAVQK